MDRRWLGVLGLVVLVVAVCTQALFTVPQWMQAMVVQLGEPVRVVREPGLYWKIPFIQQVTYFDRRLLDYNASPKEILTIDKQQLVIDNFTRWRIADPLQFYRTVRDESGAQSRLDDIVYSDVRETLGRHTLRDIVTDKAKDYGIEIVDVRIKRADLPEKNEQTVFGRMRTERERQAKKFRAEGDEEARKIRSESDKQVQILLADAKRTAEVTRGEGDAQAARIFAEAYGRDPDFYTFVRTLDAYRTALASGTTLILSPKSDFFRFLERPGGGDGTR
jgi:membrane protease subunit HflC